MWERSADAWAAFVDAGDKNRELLLDPIVLAACDSVQGLDVLDVGCGEGRFCRMLAKRGAHVVGLDPTEGLIDLAAKKGAASYVLGIAEELPFHGQTFDLLVSYVALIDVPGFRTAIREMARVLRPRGRAVVANHNSFVTTSPEGWLRDAEGRFLHVPVDNYLDERGETTSWKGIQVVNYHRPFSAYVEAFLTSGFVLRRFVEPAPTAEAVRLDPGIALQRRVPFFYVATWEKDVDRERR